MKEAKRNGETDIISFAEYKKLVADLNRMKAKDKGGNVKIS